MPGMGRKYVAIVLLAVAAIIVTISLSYSRSGSKSGFSRGQTFFFALPANQVFRVVADIDAWPAWRQDVDQVYQDLEHQSQVAIKMSGIETRYDYSVDVENAKLVLQFIPEDGLVEGRITIAAQALDANSSRLVVVEEFTVRRSHKDDDDKVTELKRERMNNFASDLFELLEPKANGCRTSGVVSDG